MESNLQEDLLEVLEAVPDDEPLYDKDDVIDSVRRRIRKMSAESYEAMPLSREMSREMSAHDPRGLATLLEDSTILPPPPIGSPLSPRSRSARSPSRVRSGTRSNDDDGLRRDSVVFLQNFLDQKNLEKNPSFLMLTIHESGEQHYDNMTLRDLLKGVQDDIARLRVVGSAPEESAMAVGQLKYRDIRRLESILSAHEEPAILVRRHVILMLLDPIRAIVLNNKMIVVIPDGADSLISMLMNILNSQQVDDMNESNGVDRLSEISNSGSSMRIPFEIKAYEAILDTVVRMHRLEYSRIETSIKKSLVKIKKRAIIPAQLQEKMRGLKNSLSSITARVSAHRRALDELLDHDDEMAVMNLTKLRSKPSLYRVPLSLEIMSYHDDIEVLIDSNFIDTTSLETELELLKDEIRGSEESVLLRLDTSRNQLLIANTQIAVCGTFAAVGSLIASMFGMNLENHYEEENHAWLYVATLTGVIIVLGILLTFVLLRKSGVVPYES